jgi:hypothetical protein
MSVKLVLLAFSFVCFTIGATILPDLRLTNAGGAFLTASMLF